MLCDRILFQDDKGNEVRAVLCITRANELAFGASEVLSESELQKYRSFKVDTGKLEFLLGRYSAKKAYCKLVQKKDLRDVEIVNGIFEQPFFKNNGEFDVSITHSKEVGGAIVFDKVYPIGLDMENLENSIAKMDVLRFVTKYDEIKKNMHKRGNSFDGRLVYERGFVKSY